MKSTKQKINRRETDLPDTKNDREKMRPEETEIELPDVKDIPGQEHIQVPPLGELADTTISSSDEEGNGLLDDEREESADPFYSDVSREEKSVLQDAADKLPTRDQENLDRAKLDKRDEDGVLLNETSNQSGSDLDVPGSEADDENEAIGEEDEENNSYSMDGEDEDESISKGT